MKIKVKNKLNNKNAYASLFINKELNLNSILIKQLKDTGKITLSIQEGIKITLYKDDFDITQEEENYKINILYNLSKKFYNHTEPISILYDAFNLENNVIFYGPGGYGKSEMTIEFFKELFNKKLISSMPYVKSLSDGTTSDDLYGGIDLAIFREKGETVYKVENSFMNYEYVIFEEFFDAHPGILLSLKDILTSKKFRNGNQIFDIKTKMIIALTNKSKQEFNTDNSTKALSDRFPISHELVWKTHDTKDFINMFKIIFSEEIKDIKFKDKLVSLAELISEQYLDPKAPHISPRTAIIIAKALIKDIDMKAFPDLINGYKLNTEKEKEEENNNNNIVKEIAENIDSLDILSENAIPININETIILMQFTKIISIINNKHNIVTKDFIDNTNKKIVNTNSPLLKNIKYTNNIVRLCFNYFKEKSKNKNESFNDYGKKIKNCIDLIKFNFKN